MISSNCMHGILKRRILNNVMRGYVFAQYHHPAARRVYVLSRILAKQHNIQLNKVSGFSSDSSDSATVSIGNVSKPVKSARNPQNVPVKYLATELSQELLQHLRWMLQKDLLKQDMFLIGRPGALRRQIAMQYLEMTSRELEYVSLSRDTTESDLKQRREIKTGTAKYFDQSAVRAAIEGRILILEGIEKAERNVLPVLNNLLENREMHLEDGRFLIPAERYDKLLKEHSQDELDKWKLVRVDEDFRVIALGIPVPRYIGNPLDPPLRSRFQARDVNNISFKEQQAQLQNLYPSLDGALVSQILSCGHALLSQESATLGLPDFPADNIVAAVKILDIFPSLPLYNVLYRLYPYKIFLNKEGIQSVESILETFQITKPNRKAVPLTLSEITLNKIEQCADVKINCYGIKTDTKVASGTAEYQAAFQEYVPTPYQEQFLTELLQSHSIGDFCVIGPRGCGKTATIQRLASLLHYQIEPIVLYQDMTSRDLIQQRTTLPNGDTVWQYSPLITAAMKGKMAVLDGIHRVHPSTLSIIQRLVQDREIQLYDGQRLIRHDRYNEIKTKQGLSDDDMRKSGIFEIHPSFRIVALAEPPVKGTSSSQWLSSELLSLFLFHEMRPLELKEELHIISKLYGPASDSMKNIMEIAHQLRNSSDPTLQSIGSSLSTRQLLRIARRISTFPTNSTADTIQRACLARFLPSLARQGLNSILGDLKAHDEIDAVARDVSCIIDGDTVKIGNTVAQRYTTSAKSKVPDILFFNVPQHLTVLECVLQDFTLGEHLLLVGNQGVGKNKLADRLLQLLNRPREYIQLHRDTTVQTLTLQPTVKDGVVVYEDSPLVQAVKNGYILVVDEADKAPTHVTCILKTLVESGEMILSDGRRIVPSSDERAQRKDPSIIPIHKDFRMIVLANRPGFPFLGNDFFGALGDLFSCHAVDNPSPESEISLLKQYGPNVPDQIISKLVKAFGELRSLADQGLVQYPYSTREVVNIVKHMQEFPNDTLANVVKNVFDFDSYSQDLQQTLTETLHKHGIPIGANPSNILLAKEFPLPKMQMVGKWSVTHSQPRLIVPAEEKILNPKQAVALYREQHPLDRVEARALSFSELQSYWVIPLQEAGIIAAMTVSKDSSNNPLLDHIHVLATNPLTLYTMQPIGPNIQQLSLQGLLTPVRGARPYYNLLSLGDKILVHEGTSNGLVLVDVVAGKAQHLPLQSAFEQASSVISRPFKLALPTADTWHLESCYSGSNSFIVYGERGSTSNYVDLNSMTIYSLSFPLRLLSIHSISADRWLIEDTDRRKYVLSKGTDTAPCPNILQPIDEQCGTSFLSNVKVCSTENMTPDIIKQILGQKMDVPNRILVADNYHAAIAIGFPDLDHSDNEIYACSHKEDRTRTVNLDRPIILQESGQVVRTIPPSQVPMEVTAEAFKNSQNLAAYLEVTDLVNKKLRYIPVPQPTVISPVTVWLHTSSDLPVFVAPCSNQGLVTVDVGGCVRLWETTYTALERSLDEWEKMIGNAREPLQLTIEQPSGKDVRAPKHGKVDETGAPHVGGNTWAGGTGGRDTAGLGGKGGPYRLDAGHTVYQVSQEEKDAVPDHVKKAAREMAQKAFKQRLKEIQMSDYDAQLYGQFSDSVSQQVRRLRVILGSLQAKSKERQWLRNQTTGELDDTKLIEGLTGEKTIYRRRAEKEPEPGSPQTKPKRLKLVVDVSGSMYRFNGYDGRLDREMEAAVMVMEAFEGFESQIQYDIVGHSGEEYDLQFVNHKQPPANNKQRLSVIKTMHAHSQFCMSGDYTLAATQQAISSISQEDCDEAIVVVLSDANLDRYGISPERFSKALTSNPQVNAYAIFIGSLGDQAARLTMKLPRGRAFVCMDLKDIPQIMQQIFTASLLNTK